MDQEHPLDTSMQSMLLWISSGRGILYANSAFCDYVGLTIEQLVGLDPRQLVEFTTGEVAEFFANPLSSAIPNRLLADSNGRIFEIKTAAREGMMDVVLDEVSGDRPLQEFLSKVSGTPFEDLAEEELRTARIPDFRFITCCAARLKPGSALASKIPPLEHRIMTGVFLEETTKPLLSHGCTLLPSRGSQITGFAGAPRYHADHSIRALEAAFEQLWRIQRVRENCNNEGRELPPVSCGIASGNSIVGGFGSGPTAAYLAEGDCVEIAELLSRIAVPGEILISASTLDHIIANLDPQWQAFEGEAEEEVDLSPYAVHAGSVIPLEGAPRILSICEVVPEGGDQPSPTYIFQEIWRLLEGDSGMIPVFRAFRPVDSAAPRTQGNAVLESGYVTRLGRYRLSEVIGSGGMGRVWKGQDAYGNTVAIKTLHSSTAESPESIRRFRREAEVMSRIPHRNICRIFEAGEHDGTYFLVMEYVEGLTLSDILHPDTLSTASHSGKSTDLPSLIAAVRKNRSSIARPSDAEDEAGQAPDSKDAKPRQGYAMPVEQAIGLMEKICEAVEFAHQHGILHRDLKPGNILLRADGEPLVADFGLAKLSGEAGTGDGPSLSLSGQVVGTVENMAPEQAESSKGVDERADVYALGTILYQMCTGRKHFTASGNLIADFQTLQNHEPLRPRAIRPTLDPDLEVIIMKCLRTDPAERYRCVSALLADLQRFRRGDPITARPVTIYARSRKFVRRHKFATIASTLLIVISSFLFFYFQRITKNKEIAEHKEKEVRQIQARQTAEKVEKENSHASSLGIRDFVPSLLASAIREAPDKKPIAQRIAYEILKRNYPMPFLKPLGHDSLEKNGNHGFTSEFSVERRNDGTLIVNSPEENFISKPFIDITKKLPSKMIPSDSEIKYFYDPFKKTLGQSFKGKYSRAILFYDLKTGHPIGLPSFIDLFELPNPDQSFSEISGFTPDGENFLFPGREHIPPYKGYRPPASLGSIPVFESGDIRLISFQPLPAEPFKTPLASIQISKSGNFGWLRDSQDKIRFFDVNKMETILEDIPKIPSGGGVFTSDEKYYFTAELEDSGEQFKPQAIYFDLWNRAARVEEVKVMEFNEKDMEERFNQLGNFFVFYPDGSKLAISGADGKVVLWDLENSTASKVFMAGSPVLSINISPNGKVLATGCLDGKVYLWNALDGIQQMPPIDIGAPVSSVAFSPNGDRLAAGSFVDHAGKINFKLWSLYSHSDVVPPLKITSEPIGGMSEKMARIGAIEFSPDGRFLVAQNPFQKTDAVLAMNLESGQNIPLPEVEHIFSAAFSSDSKKVAYSVNDNNETFGIIRSTKENVPDIQIQSLNKTRQDQGIKFSPDGQMVCMFGEGIAMFDATDGRLIWEWNGEDLNKINSHDIGGFCDSLEFNPPGSTIIESRKNFTLVRDSKTGAILSRLLKHSGSPAVAFSPDGKWIAAGTRDSLKIENWIELDHEIPAWFADFVEVYCGYRAMDSSSLIGIPPRERAGKLEEFRRVVKNKSDNFSRLVNWLSTASNERTISPDSDVLASNSSTNFKVTHDFVNSTAEAEGDFKKYSDSAQNGKFYDGALIKPGNFSYIKLPSQLLSKIFDGRKIRVKGKKNVTDDGYPVLSIDRLTDIEDIPLVGVVVQVRSGSKDNFLDMELSDGGKIEIKLAFKNDKISNNHFQQLVGKKISAFWGRKFKGVGETLNLTIPGRPREKFEISNPMDIYIDGISWLYQFEPPFRTDFQDFFKANEGQITISGYAHNSISISNNKYQGFDILELLMDSGERIGLILNTTSNPKILQPLSPLAPALFGKKITASGRVVKFQGRHQLLVERMEDVRIDEENGKLSNPWMDSILNNLTFRLEGYRMGRASGKVVAFEQKNSKGQSMLSIQSNNGDIFKAHFKTDEVPDFSDEKLSTFIGKEVEAVGSKKGVQSFQVFDSRDLKVIDLHESPAEAYPNMLPDTNISEAETAGDKSVVQVNPPKDVAEVPSTPVASIAKAVDEAQTLSNSTEIKKSEDAKEEITINGRATNFSSQSGGRFKTLDLQTNEGDVIVISFRLKGETQENPEEVIRSFADKSVTVKGKISSYHNKKQMVVTDLSQISISANPTPGD